MKPSPGGEWHDATSQLLIASGSLRVLLVEDDEAYRTLLRVTLERAASKGTQTTLEVATTLVQALEAVSSQLVDLILLDLALPDARRLEALEALVEAAPHIPVIVVTGSDDGRLAAEALRLGAQDYLVKGAGDEQLLFTLGRAVQRHRHLRGSLARERERAAQHRERAAVGERTDDGIEGHRFRDSPAFARMLATYDELVLAGIRERLFELEPTTRDKRRAFAEGLVELGATGRDVIALHAQSLERASQRSEAVAMEFWVEEARLAVLDVLAALTDTYRLRGTGAAAP